MTTHPADQKLNILHSLSLTIRAIAILVVILLYTSGNPAFALPGTEVAANQDCKSELRSLTEKNYAAWTTDNGTPDYKSLAQFYVQAGEDMVMYDPQPPVEGYTGWSNIRQHLQKNVYNNLSNIKLTMHDDFRAWCRGDVAWTTFTSNVAVVTKDGQATDVDTRQTNVWERRNGRWIVVHEHASAPLSIASSANKH